MRKNFITTMPDKAGAFLKASQIIYAHNGNITRVNYNKALDIHTLFLEIDADEAALKEIEDELAEIGYLISSEKNNAFLVIELTLVDVPGSILPVLEILQSLAVNISYMSSKSNQTGYQHFKMGLLIENPKNTKILLDGLGRICDVKIWDYDVTEKPLDNTVFYLGFANKVRNILELNQEEVNNLTIAANQIMQLLDEKNESPLKTFDYIGRFAQMLHSYQGDHFMPHITSQKISPQVSMTVIEPNCGSNTYILDDGKELLFVDCGFMAYKEEMLALLDKLFSDFSNRKKKLVLTHGDIDHCGLAEIFQEIYVSKNTYHNFELENQGLPNFREQNPLHEPYCHLSKIISAYKPLDLKPMIILGEKTDKQSMTYIGEMDFSDLHFLIFEGNGGHVKGETIFKCLEHRIIFTGDNWVNIRGFSPAQRQFNELAPYLMQSVNMDSKEASRLRLLLEESTKGYLVCPGHGPVFTNGIDRRKELSFVE